MNKFLYPKGGDAICTLSLGDLLSEKGHEVFYWGMEHPGNRAFPYKEYFVSYVDYNRSSGPFQQLKDALNILYSFEAKSKIDALLKIIKPDIVHLGNFAHQLSPSILDAIEKHNIPAVMTMHDYKLVCPAYTMLSDGKPCDGCKGGRYYFCLLKKCTKGSSLKSLVNTLEMYFHHRVLHIYDKIDIFISPSSFLMSKVKDMGFKGEIVHLPYFVNATEYQPSFDPGNNDVVYFGRLSREKGLTTLLEAMKGLNVQLKIIGDGPQRDGLAEKVKSEGLKNVIFLGYKTGKELHEEIQKSMFVIIPSEWYENYPRSVIEAFALGKPVLGAKIGGIPELIKNGETGLTFEAGNADDLRAKIFALLKDKDAIVEMGKNARRLVEDNLNPERQYEESMNIYQIARVKKYG